MANTFRHDSPYDALARLAGARITLCGAGALGSHLADNLARHGATRLRVIDHDRVEAHNVPTQVYDSAEVGLWKVEALRNRLFRATGVELDAARRELTPGNAARLLAGADLIIDAFDNSASRTTVRAAARSSGTPCLHVGLFADYGETIWDSAYRVPADPAAGDACGYPLARNLILLTTAVASEAILEFLATGRRVGRSVTLRDLAIRPMQDLPHGG